jgi:hypothetical protein
MRDDLRSLSGAEGGTRTHTGYRPLRPERSASTNSTTSAHETSAARPESGKGSEQRGQVNAQRLGCR